MSAQRPTARERALAEDVERWERRCWDEQTRAWTWLLVVAWALSALGAPGVPGVAAEQEVRAA